MVAALSQAVCDRLRKLCEVHPYNVAAELVGIHPSTLSRIKRRGWKTGRPGSYARPVPHDLLLFADKMSIRDLERHYKCGSSTMRAWLKTINRKYEYVPQGGPAKPMRPKHEIEAALAQYGSLKAAKHFGVSRETLMKWRKAYGLVGPEKAKPVSMLGWAERYFKERRAA